MKCGTVWRSTPTVKHSTQNGNHRIQVHWTADFSSVCLSYDLSSCDLLKNTGHRNPEQYTLSTLMGTAWSQIISIYLFLFNTQVLRDPWVYITNKWFPSYAFNITSRIHIALPALFQYHLHFPHIHYHAVAICIPFIPQVAPHMEITHYIPSENIAVECCSTNHPPHCYLVITS